MDKRIFLLLAIVAVIGVGVFVLQPYKEKTPEQEQTSAENNATSTQTTAEPSDEVIDSLIPEIIGPQFDASTATRRLVNVDGQNGSELIVGAIEGSSDVLGRPAVAVIHVVTLVSAEGEFERIGSIQYQELLRGVPEVKQLRDITGNGIPEIIVSLQYGGASSWAEGILQVHVGEHQLNWLQMHTKQGQTQNAIFVLAASVGHWNSVEWQDVNNDGTEELVEIFAQRLPFEDNEVMCEANVYTWNGISFAYAEQLSANVLSQLSAECEL